MQEWQYHIMPLEGKIEEVTKGFNNIGFQGWELVTVATISATPGTVEARIAIFKRPLHY